MLLYKVYTKSLLMAKKRYVGFKYESIDEAEPGFDAKGIETVRRDGFPAGQKMVESVIKWVASRAVMKIQLTVLQGALSFTGHFAYQGLLHHTVAKTARRQGVYPRLYVGERGQAGILFVRVTGDVVPRQMYSPYSM
jgi:hypothetical protein